MKKNYYYCAFAKTKSPFYGYKSFFIIPMLVTSCSLCVFLSSINKLGIIQSFISYKYWFLTAVLLTLTHFYLYYNELKRNLSFIVTHEGIIDTNLSIAYKVPWSRIASINLTHNNKLKKNLSAIILNASSNDDLSNNIKKQYVIKKQTITNNKSSIEKMYTILKRQIHINSTDVADSNGIQKLGNINLARYLAKTIVLQTILWTTICTTFCIIFDVFNLFV